MGDVADMILEGLLDEETGEYIGDDNGNGYGYPTSARKQQALSGKSKKEKFNPTTENLEEIALSLTMDHVQFLMRKVLLRVSHNQCTRYTLTVDSNGVAPSAEITGEGFLMATGTNEKNLRGEWILDKRKKCYNNPTPQAVFY